MVLRLTTYDNMKWVYPALAIFEVSASDTCFSFFDRQLLYGFF